MKLKPEWIVSFDALTKVFDEGAFSNIAVNEALSARPNCNSAFVRNMVKGVIRDRIKLDYYIGCLASSGLKSVRKRPLIVLRMGIYAICSLDSVPDHAAVDEAVNLAGRVCRGNSSFVNAMLRGFLRRRAELEIKGGDDLKSMALEYSFPEALFGSILEQYGRDEGLSIIRGLSEAPRLSLRVNTLKTTPDELIGELAAEGCSAERSAVSPRALLSHGEVTAGRAFRRGDFSVQTEASIKAMDVFSPHAGSTVLDMCAAPGGKSSAMAEMMGNSGRIVSCDVYGHRLELIKRTAERLGIDIIETRLMDGSVYDESMSESFDYVLADVPCSGLGVIGSKPEIKYHFAGINMEELLAKQYAILENAFRYVKPNGCVMYSTCTLNRDENERMVNRYLSEHGGAVIVETDTVFPYNNMVGFYYCKMMKAD